MKNRLGIIFGIGVALIMAVTANAQIQNQDEGRRFSRFAKRQGGGDLNELVINGQTRTYILRNPRQSIRNRQKLPLVIALHGGGGNAQNAERMMGWTQKASQEGFAVVYPNGSGPRSNMFLTWNGKNCCAHAMENNIDDVGFISALIDKLIRENNIDPSRVYITGMSNGAIMSHRIGAELSSKIAAIAPVVGTVFGDEQIPRVPVSALIINGALDKNVPPEGGFSQGRSRPHWGDLPMKPAGAQAEFWARANSCNTPRSSISGQIQKADFRCPNGVEVEQIMVLDGGHSWPGGQRGSQMGDAPSQSYNATNEIWDFFKDKHK